ncbi:Syntaxin-1A [Sarcoptes scabiei]|uniref:Syntaxin-1A n=1 Tax=Sarcoptes scabiei TaxID=52283 RepID=A0A834R4M8_SARSC|nr:Syntaxin-1A [Sarcoptes scabiei]UXI14870.1 cyclin-related protein FAM58A isoform X6 [Sarcoptes scabiei]
MVRDRTAEFKKRAGLSYEPNHIDDADSSISDQASIKIQTNDIEKFFDHVETTKNRIDQMEILIKQMKDLHSEVLLSAKPDEKCKKLLDNIDMNFKLLSKQIKEDLNSIEVECKQIANKNSAEYRMRTIQFQMLRQKMLDTMNIYHSAQGDYRTKNKDLLRRQISITNQNITNEELDKILDNPSSEIFIQGHLTETREAREQLAEIQARHADILKIEKSIRELHDMFIEMSTLVMNQGESINRIENHVKSTHDYLQDANEQTKQAMEYKAKARKCKIFIAIILIVLVLIIVFASFY